MTCTMRRVATRAGGAAAAAVKAACRATHLGAARDPNNVRHVMGVIVKRGLLSTAALALLGSITTTEAAVAKIVTFPQKYALHNSTYATVQGTVDSHGGCVFPGGAMTVTPAQAAVEMRETSINTKTCTATIEKGVPPNGARSLVAGTSATVKNAGQRRGIINPFLGAPAQRTTLRATYGSSSGYEKDWWEDPLGIDVNKTISHLSFQYDGRCIRKASWYGEKFLFSTSGWTLTSWNNRGYFNCGSAYSTSYAHFHNGKFCAGASVDTYYDRTMVSGWPDGTLHASWRSYNVGPRCKSLLSFHHTASQRFGP